MSAQKRNHGSKEAVSRQIVGVLILRSRCRQMDWSPDAFKVGILFLLKLLIVSALSIRR